MKDIIIRQAVSAGFIGSRRFERERYLTLLVEMLSEFLQARKASIMLLDKDQQILNIVAAKGLDGEFVQNTRLEVGDRIAGKVAQTGEPLHVFDIENDGEYGRANNTLFYGTRSFISTPLRDGDEIVGVLNVSDHVEGREFTRADRELLEALSSIIVGMIKKLDAYEKVSMNFEKLKEAMRASLDMREAWGSRNLVNLTLIALTIGKRLALDERSLTALRLGMNLYDLGLMRIPRNIRIKKEDLTPKEREVLRGHPNIGFALTSPMNLEDRVMKMIRSHHEQYDGNGYPDGLSGNEIPVEARIVSVVDAFRALMSEGPYRRTFSLAEARAEIEKGALTRFDPDVVKAFGSALDDLGARDDKHELVLEAVEKELQQGRIERQKRLELLRQEPVKEEIR
jgi:HD-GYP domain-containing protein (c-di-GMP phosphodiesterase class II)